MQLVYVVWCTPLVYAVEVARHWCRLCHGVVLVYAMEVVGVVVWCFRECSSWSRAQRWVGAGVLVVVAIGTFQNSFFLSFCYRSFSFKFSFCYRSFCFKFCYRRFVSVVFIIVVVEPHRNSAQPSLAFSLYLRFRFVRVDLLVQPVVST
jgi:hypothetical protein